MVLFDQDHVCVFYVPFHNPWKEWSLWFHCTHFFGPPNSLDQKKKRESAMLKFHRKKHRTWTLNLHRKKSTLLNNQCWIGALGPGALDIWDPRKWKGLLFRGTPRIPNHRAPNHPFTIGWTFSPPKKKHERPKMSPEICCSPSSTSTLIYIYTHLEI